MLGFFAERDQAFLAALAGDPQHALAQVDGIGRQVDQLTDAQAGGIHQLEHGAVAQAERRVDVGAGQQRVDLAFGERLGQQAGQLGRIEQRAGVVAAFAAADGIGEERTQGGEQAGIAARRPAMTGAPGEVIEQPGAIEASQATRGAITPAREPFEIAPIAVQAGARKAVFGPGGVEEALDADVVVVAQLGQVLHELAAQCGGGGVGHADSIRSGMIGGHRT